MNQTGVSYTSPLGRRMYQNIHGNWSGYLKGQTVHFGLDEQLARLWSEKPSEYEEIVRERRERGRRNNFQKSGLWVLTVAQKSYSLCAP